MDRRVLFVLLMCVFIRGKSHDVSHENGEKKDLIMVPSEANVEQHDTGETSFKDENDFDAFQPTNEWQTIEEGQAIPRGLHIQINLQTGQKKAKLMDENIGVKYEEKAHSIKTTTKQNYLKIDKNVYIPKQKLKDALNDFKDKFRNEDFEEGDAISPHAKTKYRSMDEIKNDFADANIWMKKDIEIIQELVEKINNSESTKAEILEALDELEYYVHQIDNARDLDTIGGLALVVNFLNQSDQDIKSHAAHVIGSAAQSNLPVQISLVETGVLPLLTRLLVDTKYSLATRKRAMYGLSSVLRLFHQGTQRFLKIGGLSMMASLFQESGNDPLKIKALTLLVDLLTEQMDGIRKKAKEMGIQDYERATLKAPLLKAMYNEGWCDLATSLGSSRENDTREKLLESLEVLLPACRSNFEKNNHLRQSLEKWKQEWQEEINSDRRDDTGYLESLVKLVDDLIGKLSFMSNTE